MRPLFHPSLEEITVEGLLYALADPIRVKIVMALQESSCSQICSNFLKVKGEALPKSTLSQHFRILREAGLIRSERKGVELHNTLRCVDLRTKFGPLLETILKSYALQAESPKRRRP